MTPERDAARAARRQRWAARRRGARQRAHRCTWDTLTPVYRYCPQPAQTEHTRCHDHAQTPPDLTPWDQPRTRSPGP